MVGGADIMNTTEDLWSTGTALYYNVWHAHAFECDRLMNFMYTIPQKNRKEGSKANQHHWKLTWNEEPES